MIWRQPNNFTAVMDVASEVVTAEAMDAGMEVVTAEVTAEATADAALEVVTDGVMEATEATEDMDMGDNLKF